MLGLFLISYHKWVEFSHTNYLILELPLFLQIKIGPAEGYTKLPPLIPNKVYMACLFLNASHL